MRAAIVLFVLAIAGFMGWKALQPDCPGGQVVSIEEECRAKFGAPFCAKAWPQTDRVARRSGEVHKTQSACLEQWPVCIERADVAGWSPRPARFCIARDGEAARIEPVYSRR